MRELQEYVKLEQRFRPSMTLLTSAGRQAVADSIDCSLSPENLSCDGERSITEQRRRYRELTKLAQQLQKLDPSVKFYEFG